MPDRIEKKHDKYSFGLKAAIAILQGVCVGIIVAALMTINYWLDGTWQISQLGRSFEETAIFLRDTENIIRRKVRSSINESFFTTDGQTDLNKEIDIRQYVSGVTDEANRNENLTFRLSDLINYYPKISKLRNALESVLTSQSSGKQEFDIATWEDLSKATESCEIILPVSGKTLAETARASQTPFETLLEYYQNLVVSSEDVYENYKSYVADMKARENSGNEFAPSNIVYYIENTTTKQFYTNLNVKGVAAARTAIDEDPGLTFLFDGVRTMDVMVANTEMSLNEAVTTKFMDTTFVSSNERVTIAVNRSYPAGDELRKDYLAYQQRRPAVTLALVCGGLALAMLVILFFMSIYTTGRSSRNVLLDLKGFDLIATEIALGVCVVAGLSWFYLSRMILNTFIPEPRKNAWIVVMVVCEYEIILLSLLSLIRRVRHNTLWENSVIRMITRVSAQVLEARTASTKMLAAYVVFMVLNFLFLRFFGTVGIVSVIVLDLAILLYLVRDRLGKLSVKAGLRELSRGKLDYRIDTSSLNGDSLEMAVAVNEMGDGLQNAVDSMIKSERLKAELITNVSHDLKTPLTSIISYVDLLKREKLDNERAEEYIDILERKSLRLKSLITDLIDASKISSGNVELHMTTLDLRSMVQMAVGEFEDRFELVPLKVEMTATQSYFVRADGEMLWRVLDNLLGNIAKYAEPESTVRILIREENGKAVCSFENRSREILSKSAQELEERFVRGDASRNSEGSGLGLSIARSLTELMEGEFLVETTSEIFRASVLFSIVDKPEQDM